MVGCALSMFSRLANRSSALTVYSQFRRHTVAVSTTTLSCKCGTLKLGVRGDLRYRLECLCSDCRGSLVLCTNNNQDGHPKIQDIIDCKKGADNWYFGNSLIVSNEAKKHIDFFKLREHSLMINMKAACCNQFMCAIHPLYKGGVFVTSPAGPSTALPSNTTVPPQLLSSWIR